MSWWETIVVAAISLLLAAIITADYRAKQGHHRKNED
jgi:hypothetical protein